MQCAESWLWHVGSGSLIRDGTQAPALGAQSLSPWPQRSPEPSFPDSVLRVATRGGEKHRGRRTWPAVYFVEDFPTCLVFGKKRHVRRC